MLAYRFWNRRMITRRSFIKTSAAATLGVSMQSGCAPKEANKNSSSLVSSSNPNILYIFSDQWRHSDHGYAGNDVSDG